MGANHPHDSLFRDVFSRPRLAAHQLRAVLPPALLAQLDLDRVRTADTSFIAQSLGTFQADLLFEVPWAQRLAYVYVLHEHQSTVDRFMAQRLLLYMSLIWDRHRKTHESQRRLPPIVPVVIYQGGQPWTGSTAFEALVAYPPGEEGILGPHVPRFEFVLDDLSESSEAALRSRSEEPLATLALLLLKLAQLEREAFLQALLRLADLLNRIEDHGDRVLITRYILVLAKSQSEEVLQTLDAAVTRPVKEALMTAAEQLQERGRLSERRRCLLKALARLANVDDATRARVDSAPADQLELWFDRALEAKTLTEVFGE